MVVVEIWPRGFGPVHACLLQVFHPVFQHFLFFDELCELRVAVLPSVILQDLHSVSKVFILTLQLENVSVEAVYHLALLLDGFSKAKVALEDFFHHVDCVYDPLSDGVFAFICCIR